MGLKRLVKKVTKPIGKAVKKIVPKEIAGIMQVAAPFTGAAAPKVSAAVCPLLLSEKETKLGIPIGVMIPAPPASFKISASFGFIYLTCF